MGDLVDVPAEWLTGLFVASLLMFFGSLFVLPLLLARMPADYFIRERSERVPGERGWVAWLAGKLFKNSLGGLLILAGIAMLVLPGQGLITLLIGLSLVDFPGKRAVQLAIIRRPRVHKTVNWLRMKYGRPPVIVDEP